MNGRLIVRGLILFGSFVALGVILKVTKLGSILDEHWIEASVRGQGIRGELLFIAVGMVATAVGLPRQAVGFLGGYAFGFAVGTLLSVLAAALGCAVAFWYARLLGRDLVMARFAHRVRRIDAFLSGNPLAMTLLIRFLPVGSNLATNLAAGVSGVSAVAFIAGSALGYVPQQAVFALVGSGVTLDPALRIGVGAVLFVVSGALGVYLYRRYRRGAALDDDIDRVDGNGAAAP